MAQAMPQRGSEAPCADSPRNDPPRNSEEMIIVDTFTRLIFGDGGEYDVAELRVIEALREVEPDVATDDLYAMGEYLRALGVAEMVSLVARVQHSGLMFTTPAAPETAPGERAGAC
ncbi:hypothetical protein FV139_20140 [Parahaliea maris]|uniref:Uncharacterized protein n=1 Tax=Parahaliea maris TaxID=2716870 RepID=A0A5C8ZNC0_9GAMM|nr:hypothetical protein [Parahaliea maris]TXS89252.1 hypothetical protein FV139_20140 [Parahaliea maris]